MLRATSAARRPSDFLSGGRRLWVMDQRKSGKERLMKDPMRGSPPACGPPLRFFRRILLCRTGRVG